MDAGQDIDITFPEANLCHDCTIKVLNIFPEFFREKFKGSCHLHEGECGYNYPYKEYLNA